jgi:Xaa-Pro aminopeptidase
LLRPGRRAYAVLADIEHLLRSQGCTASFNLIMPSNDFDVAPSSAVIRADLRYTVEISPRFGGYFTQLTAPVTFGPAPRELRAVYEANLRVRELAGAWLRPGRDILEVCAQAERLLQAEGYALNWRSRLPQPSTRRRSSCNALARKSSNSMSPGCATIPMPHVATRSRRSTARSSA